MRKHPDRLASMGITPERYRELQDMCRQYPEHVRKIRRVRAGIVDRPTRKGGGWKRPDPTGNAAVNIAVEVEWMEARVKMIDNCVKLAAPAAIAKAILKNVTEDWSYEYLKPPCGKNQFYDYRHWFYVLLDRAMKSAVKFQ